MRHEVEVVRREKEQTFRRARIEPQERNLCTRALTARTIAGIRRCRVEDVIAELWPDDPLLLQTVTRTSVLPATTYTAGWAAELAQKRLVDTAEALGAASGAADVMAKALLLDWDGAGIISAPGFTASANAGGFVQESQPIPVRQLALGPAQLLPYKLASIAALSREMSESSNAERLIADALVRSAGLALDVVFFGNAAATAAQPAGIRNGISTSAASAAPDPFGAVFEDIGTLITSVSAVGGKGPFILVASPGRIASMRMRFNPGADDNISYAMSTAVGNDLIAISAPALVAAISADPDVETANAATLVMDTAPVTPDTTQPTKEMWQTDSIAVKVRWPVSWALRAAGAVAWLTPAWK